MPLKQQSTGRLVAPLDTFVWFWANQSLLLLLNATGLVEKQQIPIFSLWFDSTWDRTHDLPHSRRKRESLFLWCSFMYFCGQFVYYFPNECVSFLL